MTKINDVKLSNAMYTYHKQVHPPTCVEHSLYCNFYSTSQRSLVVAGGTVLKIYRLILDGLQPSDPAKLEHQQTFNCFGVISSIEKIRLNPARDSLLIVFKDAKVSLVEYDPLTHDLKSLAIRSLEKEDYKEGFQQSNSSTLIKVDPMNRCAAVLIYDKYLAIIPFVKRDAADLADPIATLKNTQTNTSGFLEYYTIKLLELEDDKGVNNIHDITFLSGYYEPTLLLLYEPIQTWSGRIAMRQDTCSIMALSLNVYQRVHPTVWSYSNLPYNSFGVLPVPKPIGGVLILSTNALLYLNQSVPPYGVSLNGFTDSTTNFPLKEQEDCLLTLDSCKYEFYDETKILLTLRNGDIYVLNLFTDGMRSISKFTFKKIARAITATCISFCEPGYFFLGSRSGDSLLVKYTHVESVEVDEEPEVFKLDEVKPPVEDAAAQDGEAEAQPDGDEESKTNGDAEPEREENGEVAEVGVKTEVEEPVVKMEEDEGKVEEDHEEKEVEEEVVEPEKIEEIEEDSQEPPQKKAKIESDDIEEWMAGDVNAIQNDDIRHFNQPPDADGQTAIRLEVADRLMNLGPILRSAMGEPAFQSELSNKGDHDVEMVSTCGHGRSGALCILQRTIKPQVITTFELQGCLDLWTVRSSTTRPQDVDEAMHQFLILSKADSTMILQTGQEINELDHSGFCTQSPTIFAGNLVNGRYIIQVCPNSVRLLEGVRQLQQVPIDVGSPLVSASIADPHVLVITQNGLVIHLTLRGDDAQGYKLSVLKPQFPGAKSKITAHCIYKDISGLFVTQNRKAEDPSVVKKVRRKSTSETIKKAEETKPETMDDEDALLYGSSVDIKDLVAGGLNAAQILPASQANDELVEDEEYEEELPSVKPADKSFWVFLARENGALEIYSLPDYKLRYYVKNFPLCNRVLENASLAGQVTGTPSEVQLPKVLEICMTALGLHSTRPLLLARVESELQTYEVYPFYEKQKEGHLKIQFRKIPTGINMEPRRTYKQKEDDPTRVLKWIRPFEDVGGYNGVLVCGRRPHWIFLTARGELRAHPMLDDGRVYSFATFHNINCERGFLFFNKDGELRICTLPNQFSYDAHWPTRKIPIRATPVFVNYHVDSRTYCVISCVEKAIKSIPKLAGEDKEFEPIERNSRFIPPTTEKYSLELWSPVSWEAIPNTKIDMDEWEKVTCVKNVMLACEGTTSGEKGLIAVGTILNFGEDCTAKGQIMLFDVIEVVPEPGQPLTRSKPKMILSKTQNAPITALCSVNGLLMAAVGQKLFLYQLKDNDLVGRAFIDTQVYIISAVSLKSFILIGDVYKSVSLLRYQEESRTFAVVSRDIKPVQVYSVEFLIDNSQMAFIVSDAQANMLVYMYQPENRETCGGQRLIRRGDFNIGSRVNCMFRIRCRLAEIPRIERRLMSMMETRHATIYAALNGSMGFFLPIVEKTYRRLLMLQNVLNNYCPHVGGLNPKAFRLVQTEVKTLSNPQKNVVDGDLISVFSDLNFNEKAEVARKIGTTVHQIQLDLAEIEGLTFHF